MAAGLSGLFAKEQCCLAAFIIHCDAKISARRGQVLLENRLESCHMLVRNRSEALLEFNGSPAFEDDIFCILCLDVK